MPLAWKIANVMIVLLPKVLLWKLTVETGVTFLMETAGISDIVVNSVALSFILNFDEMIYNVLTTWETRQMLSKVEEYAPYDLTEANSWSDEQIMKKYDKFV